MYVTWDALFAFVAMIATIITLVYNICKKK